MKQKYLKALKGTFLASATLLTSLGCFTACTATDDLAANATWQTDPTAVNLAAGVGTNSVFTRSNPGSDDTEVQKAFSAGDQLVVSATGQAAVTYELGADNTTWTPTDATAYLKWASKPMHMDAFYPAPYTSTLNGANNASMTTFKLPERQNDPTPTGDSGIGRADYMTFSDEVTPGGDGGVTASITMQRQTARVRIVLAELGNEIDTENEKLSVFVYSAYKGIPTTSDGNDATQFVYPHDGSNMQKDGTCTALVIPGAGKPGEIFLDVNRTKKNGTVIASLRVTGIPTMEAGKSYTYRLRVGKDKVEIASVTVDPWETGSVLGDATNGNEAEVIVETSSATHTLTVNKAGALTAQHITTALGTATTLTVNGSLNANDMAKLTATTALTGIDLRGVNYSGTPGTLGTVPDADWSACTALAKILINTADASAYTTAWSAAADQLLYPGKELTYKVDAMTGDYAEGIPCVVIGITDFDTYRLISRNPYCGDTTKEGTDEIYLLKAHKGVGLKYNAMTTIITPWGGKVATLADMEALVPLRPNSFTIITKEENGDQDIDLPYMLEDGFIVNSEGEYLTSYKYDKETNVFTLGYLYDKPESFVNYKGAFITFNVTTPSQP